MVFFSQVMLAVIALLVPVIVLSVYCYTQDKGWKPVLYGCLSLVIVQIVLRMVIPLSFGRMDWYQNLLVQPVPYLLVYALISAILEIGILWLFLRFALKQQQSVKTALVLGFSYGVMEGALFSGFNALSALLSTNPAAGAPADYFLAAIEAVCMWVFHAVFALLVFQSIEKKSVWPVLAAFCACFVMLAFGAWMTSILQMRGLLEFILLIAAALCAWWIWKNEFHKRKS